MKCRQVIFSLTARRDLRAINEWITERASSKVARDYVGRIERFCLSLEYASERGSLRDSSRDGLRIIGFERSVTIGFAVFDEEVTILRVLRRGADWRAHFR